MKETQWQMPTTERTNDKPLGKVEKKVDLLSEEQTEKIQSFADGLLESYLEGRKKLDTFRELQIVEDSLEKIACGDADENYDFRKIKAATSVFVAALFNFCEDNYQDENFPKFLESIREAFFSSSPCVSSNMSLEDKFKFTAISTRSAEIYGQIGESMSGDLVYSLSYENRDGNFDKFLKIFEQSSYAEKFDQINLFERLSAEAIGSGDTFKNGKYNLDNILKLIKKDSKSAFLNYYITLAEKKIKKEKENSTIGFIRTVGDTDNLRLSESLNSRDKEESDKLNHLIYTEEKGLKQAFVRIASDAIAISDRSNTPIKYGYINSDELEAKSKNKEKPKVAIDVLVKGIGLKDQIGNLDMGGYINFINQNILIPYFGIEANDYEKLSEVLSKFSSDFSGDDWLKYLKNESEIKKIREKLILKTSERTKEAEDKNFEATLNFYKNVESSMPIIIKAANNKRLEETFSEFKKELNDKEYEYAFSLADNCARYAESICSNLADESISNLAKNLALVQVNLREKHINNFGEAEKENNDLYQKVSDDNKELISSYSEFLKNITTNKAQLVDSVTSELNRIKEETKSKMIEVKFIPYSKMGEDGGLAVSMDKSKPQDTFLLLQHLQRPGMRHYLENKLGLDLKEIPLRYQIQLLKFLSESDEAKVDSAASFINEPNSKEKKLDRIKSFLSLQVDKNDGDRIIEIGNSLGNISNKVFAKISMVIDLIEKKNDELREIFWKDDKNFDFSEIRLKLLEKIHKIISDFSSFSRVMSDSAEKLMDDLENSQVETFLLASVLESLKENGQEVDLETIRDMDLHIMDYGSNLSDREKIEILTIAKANWNNYGNDKLAQTNVDGLEKSLEDNVSNKRYVLKYKEEIIGFVRFEKTEHNTLYAGSFNVSKDLRGLSIGTELMENALLAEGENNILEAVASVKTPIGCSFVEKVGFVVDGLINDYHGTGEKIISIKLDKLSGKEFETRKNQNLEELKNKVSDYKKINQLLNEPIIVLKFDFKSELNECEEALSILLAKTNDDLTKQELPKYNLTRYFQDKAQPGDVRYLVFEKQL